MNWEAIGAVGEIAGAVAVVLSLIYLASQIRYSNRLMTLEATRDAFDQSLPVVDMILTDDHLMEILIKDRDSLTEVERAKLLTLGRRMIMASRQIWLTRDEVRGVEGLVRIYKAMYHREGINYGMPDVWTSFKDAYEPEFAAWFDENVASK